MHSFQAKREVGLSESEAAAAATHATRVVFCQLFRCLYMGLIEHRMPKSSFS